MFISGLDRVYTARALVILDRPATQMLDGRGAVAATDPFMVRSEVDLLWSDAVAERVVAAEGLAELPAFSTEPAGGIRSRLAGLVDALRGIVTTPSQDAGADETAAAVDQGTALLTAVVERYKDGLGISNDGRSLAVGISMEAGTPALAARLANAHAYAYLDLKSEELAGAYRSAGDLLQREIERSAQRLSDAELAAATFRNETEALRRVGPSSDPTGARSEIEQLRTAIVDAERSIADLAATLTQLRDEPDAASLMESVRTPMLTRLRTAAAEALVEVRQGVATFGAADAAVAQAQARLDAADDAILEEVAAITRQVEVELAQRRALLSSLRDLVADEADQWAAYNIAEAEYRTLLTQAEISRALHESNLQRQSDLRLADGLLGTNATLVSLAQVPIKPSFPRPTLFLLLGIVVSAVVALLAALAANTIWGRAAAADVVAQEAGLPALATIALPRRAGPRHLDRARTWDGLRTLRARAAAMSDAAALIAVTGSRGADHSAAVAVGLARAFAATGAPTLLIDCDPHGRDRTDLLRALGARNGLLDVLRSGAEPDSLIVNGGLRNLDILPLGESAGDAADLLASKAVADLMARVRLRYRHAILILPDADASAEGSVLAAEAGMVIAVVRRGRRAARHVRLIG